jgi:hypothetical protein
MVKKSLSAERSYGQLETPPSVAVENAEGVFKLVRYLLLPFVV